MIINLVTAVPEYFTDIFNVSIVGRAVRENFVTFNIISLREFADGKLKKQVDDAPYGGGAGMILKVEPIYRALKFLEEKNIKGQVFLTSAKGPIFNQSIAQNWSQLDALTLVCGHYEGVDERVLNFVDGEISLGQFVLTGGEAAANAMIDATVRLLPGVLGNPTSLVEESFAQETLEYPQYTRPEDFLGFKVPEILLSGNHGAIANWRNEKSTKLK
ncbi:MAG: tRNA (guanosine(37)-N1)-methyltransferase TrmD [bacterium]|nr:tRNA (guanosine(37)-N1)-methyltransferase TrmD [bacterium]